MFFNSDNPLLQAWLLFSVMNQQSNDSCGIVNSSPMTVASPSITQSFKPFQQCLANNQIEAKSRKLSNITSADIPKYQSSAKRAKKTKKNEIDDDYFPAQNSQKRGGKGNQNQNRNVVPNSIHQILSFAQKKKKSLVYVIRVFDKFEHQEECTINRFYLYQMKLKEKINHYVNQKALKLLNQLHDPNFEIFSNDQQLFYLKVSRIIIHQFLNKQSMSIILTSKKMGNDKKKNHLTIRRFLKQKLQEIYKN